MKMSTFDAFIAELEAIVREPPRLAKASAKPPLKTKPKPMLLFFRAPNCRDGIVLKTRPKSTRTLEKSPCAA